MLTAALSALLALGAVGCSEPALPGGPVESTGSDVPPAPDTGPDPELDALGEQLDQLEATVEAATEQLRAVADATSPTARRSAAEQALGLLLEDSGTAPRGLSPLLPARSPEREGIGDRSDLLGTTLALARDVGGSHGTAVTDLLRELGGDLGAWERDAAGVVAGARRAAGVADGGEDGEDGEDAASDVSDLDGLTARILDLPGETTRALAWTFVAVETDDRGLASDASERAVAHLEFVKLAMDELERVAVAPTEDGDAP